MALSAEQKGEIINQFRLSPHDTGSVEVQTAVLTKRINDLTEHLKIYRKDEHSRHGLRKMVSNRRSLLDYLKRINLDRYLKLIKELEIRR
jgi:small subunit ribosomal protein S15